MKGDILMNYYYNPEIKLLLLDVSKLKVVVTYQDNEFQLPMVGPRPPYYTNPKYEQYFPTI